MYQSVQKSARVKCGGKPEHHRSLWQTQALLQRYSVVFEISDTHLKTWTNTTRIINRGAVSSLLLSCHFLPVRGRWRGQPSWPHSGTCWPEPAPPPPSAPSPQCRHRPAHPGSEGGRRE